VRRTGNDEPIGVIIHTCMETLQGNSLSLSQTSKNILFFFLSFFFCKIRDQEGRTGSGDRGDINGKERWWEKGIGG
jgi:hypothetical protein